MMIAETLGKTLDELNDMTPEEYLEWLAFIREKNRRQKAAERRNR